MLTTREMNMPSTADCRNDHILVTSKIKKKSKSLTVFCGQKLFAPYIVKSATHVQLKFKSDYKREGRFQILYQQIPN